jgi:hypothetical protein
MKLAIVGLLCLLVGACASSGVHRRGGRGAAGASLIAVNEAGDELLARLATPLPEQLEVGLRRYERRRYFEAAVAFSTIRGASDAGEAAREAAEFFLAKSLFHAGYCNAAAAVFASIAAEEGHPFSLTVLPWLAALDQRLDDRELLLEMIEGYRPQQVGEGVVLQGDDVDARLHYLMGLVSFRRGGDRETARRMARIPRSSSLWVSARFYTGTVEARRGEAMLALNAFHDVAAPLAARPIATEGGVMSDEERLLHDLAWMNIGRLHGSRTDFGDLALRRALEAYERVPRDSSLAPRADFEGAVLLHRLGGHAEALRALEPIPSSWIDAHPEVSLFRAEVLASSCLHDEAHVLLRRAEAQARSLHRQVDEWVAAHGDAQLIRLASGEGDDLEDEASRLLREARSGTMRRLAEAYLDLTSEIVRLAEDDRLGQSLSRALLRELEGRRGRVRGRLVALAIGLSLELVESLAAVEVAAREQIAELARFRVDHRGCE